MKVTLNPDEEIVKVVKEVNVMIGVTSMAAIAPAAENIHRKTSVCVKNSKSR